jgi:hypothetical protein
MEQAASQIHDSRDLSGASGMRARVSERAAIAKQSLMELHPALSLYFVRHARQPIDCEKRSGEQEVIHDL